MARVGFMGGSGVEFGVAGFEPGGGNAAAAGKEPRHGAAGGPAAAVKQRQPVAGMGQAGGTAGGGGGGIHGQAGLVDLVGSDSIRRNSEALGREPLST